MKKLLFLLMALLSGLTASQALIINEIMSNPIGDDGGREWVEIYNDGEDSINLSALTLSIKGGTPLLVTSLQGGTALSKNGYAIISSTVTGASKFLQDYPNYSGVLLKSAISLVNTGITSIELKISGHLEGSALSYTASKEGNSYAFINGTYVLGTPTPGAENQTASPSTDDGEGSSTSTNQYTITQTSAPTADIVLYLPFEKIVIAGVVTNFSTSGMTRGGKVIENMTYSWSFGDGGQGTGSTTVYSYNYPGRYIAQVEGGNGLVSGVGRMKVRVVSPDIAIKGISTGKYGTFIDIDNPNSYDIDFSQWRLSIDGVSFSFPKNTLISANGITHLSGMAMGFASTTFSSSTLIKILFPTLEEVTRYTQNLEEHKEEIKSGNFVNSVFKSIATTRKLDTVNSGTFKDKRGSDSPQGKELRKEKEFNSISTTTLSFSKNITIATSSHSAFKKDTRIALFFRNLFSW